MESGKTSLSSFNHLPYFAHAKITFDHRFTVYISDTSSSYHLHHHHQHHPQASSPSHITFLIFETLATLTHPAWQMLFEVWIQYSRRLTIQNIGDESQYSKYWAHITIFWQPLQPQVNKIQNIVNIQNLLKSLKMSEDYLRIFDFRKRGWLNLLA